jgi:hypothetical protein
VAVIVTARRAATAALPAAGWRRALAGVAPVDDDDEPAMALALEIAVTAPPTRYGTGAPTLAARPMRMGRNGAWIKTGASWRDVEYGSSSSTSSSSPPFDVAQQTALKALLSTASTAAYYRSTQPVPLEQFGPTFWYHLARAVEVGVELVGAGTTRDGVVLSSHPATASLDLTADADGAVSVSCVLSVDGEPLRWDPRNAGLLGDPAHGLFVIEAGTARLIPLAQPLAPDLARLVTGPPVVVPPEDVDEFMDAYQPTLARLAPVGSSDGTVKVERTAFDGLVLTIGRPSVDAATLRWSARYRRGDRTVDHPVRPEPGRAHTRDRAAEQAALDTLDLPTHLLAELVGPTGTPADLSVQGYETVLLLDEVVPWLEARGQVRVEVAEGTPELREATADPLISLGIRDSIDPRGEHGAEGQHNDWFDLDVEVSVDGEAIDFASLFAALALEQEVLILPSGTWLRLDRPEFGQLRALIEEAQGLLDP